jgi:hypothetical protein
MESVVTLGPAPKRPHVDIVCSRSPHARTITRERFEYLDHRDGPYVLDDSEDGTGRRTSTESDAPHWSQRHYRRLPGGAVVDADGLREWFEPIPSALKRNSYTSPEGARKVTLECSCGLSLPIAWGDLVRVLDALREGGKETVELLALVHARTKGNGPAR